MFTIRKQIIVALATFVFVLSSCTKNAFFSDGEFKFLGLSKAQVEADGTVSMQWAEVPVDAVKYYVYRKEKGSSFDWANPLTVLTSNLYTHPAYSIKKQYCFAVRFTSIDSKPDENTEEICPEMPVISGFDGVDTGTSTQTGIADITWKAPTVGLENVAGYRIYKDAEFKSLALTAKANQTSIVIPDLTPEQEYSFGVRVVDKYGREDDNTRTVTVFVVNNGMPAFAGLVSAKKSAADSVTLTWPSVDGRLKEFRVYKATGADSDTLSIEKETPFKVVGPSLLTTTVTGLGDEQKHCFLVRAATSSGQEDINEISKCVTLPDNGPPEFSGIKTVQFGQSGVDITWDAAVGETKEYRIYYQVGSSINFSTATTAVITAPALTGTIAGLLDNTTYSFAVRAVDSRGQADNNTHKVAVSTSDITPPNFGGYVGIVALDDARVKVTFNRSVETDTSHYSIRYRRNGTTDAYVESGIQPQVGSGTIEHTITGLLPATTYQVLVKAVDSSGNLSTNSATLTRQTLDLLPPSFGGITSVAAKAGDATRAVATWSAATDAGGVASYFVYYSKGSLSGVTLTRTDTFPKTVGGNVIYITSAITSGVTTEFAGLDQGQNYFFVAHAVDNAGNEDSNTTQATYSVPYYVAPAAPTSVGFNPSPSGPTANQNPSVVGVGATGNLIRVYVNGTLAANGAINSGTAFSIPITLPGTTGDYTVTVTQVNPSGIEGPIATAPLYQLLLTRPTAAITGAPTNSSTNGFSSIDVTVSNSSNVTHYKYALMNFNNIACGNATYSASWIAVATHITETLSTDGAWRLCVIAKDSADNTQEVTSATQVDWTRDSSAPASAVLTGGPSANSNAVNLDVTVSGTGITDYKYIVVQGADGCVGQPYGALIPVATHITAATGTVDEARKLCVVGYNSAGNPQSIPSSHSWNRKVALPTISFFEVQDKTTSLGTETTSPNVKVAFTASVDATHYCVKLTSTPPTIGDGCWGTSNTPLIYLGATTTGSYTVYGWVKDVAGNVSATSSDAITFTNYCDSGDLDNACAVTTNKVVPSGTTLAGNGSITMTGGVLQTSAQQTMTINIAGDLNLTATSVIASNATITAANISLSSSSVIRADALGYTTGASSSSNGNGPGGGYGSTTGGCTNAALVGGGSHGGFGGGIGTCPQNTTTYGSLSQPTTWGSAGGRSGGSGSAGNGGGAIRIITAGTLTVASGTTVSSIGSTSGGGFNGGGAGGSVWITANQIVGTGTLSVAGGSGGGGNAAGGGGGRLSLTASNPFHGTISVAGGSFGNPTQGTYYLGGTGVCDSGNMASTCTITGPVLIPNGYSFTGSGSLSLAAGGSLNVANPLDTISIAMTGSVTVQTGASINANMSSVTAANFTIQTGATVSANALGNVGGTGAASLATGSGNGGGAGNGTPGGPNCYYAASGGAYGGAGGWGSQGCAPTNTYGSTVSPASYGSGGGGAGLTGANGGNGGGLLKFIISNTMTIDGTVSAEGGIGAGGSSTAGGGGSGGSIWIISGAMAGGGTISAKGGAGISANWTSGGGGGGRIAIDSPVPFHGAINFAGGTAPTYPGLAGTFTLVRPACDTGTLDTTCTITGPTLLSYGSTPPSYTGSGNLVITGGGSLYTGLPLETLTIDLAGDVTVQSSASILANLPTFNANNVTIQSGGIISASAKGFIGGWMLTNGTGTGAGNGQPVHTDCYYGAGGGSHGGASGKGHGACLSTPTLYGSASSPVTYGSSGAGGVNGGSQGGNGGGAIKLVATGLLTVDGTLSADGGAGGTNGSSGGGGAGGSLWITSSSLAGAGSITAKGGNGGIGNWYGGAGGGGRISLTSSNPFHGTLSVATGVQGNGGAYGSIYYGSSFCTSGSLATTCTINGPVLVPNGFAFSATGNLILGPNAVLAGLGITDSISFAVGGAVTMQSGSQILMNLTNMTGSSFTMQTGAVINASARGVQAVMYSDGSGTGPGLRTTADGNGGGGGAHGGNGGKGNGVSGGLGGSYYGSKLAPVTIGSSGGGSSIYGIQPGSGGGVVRINVTGSASIVGSISADGQNASGAQGGAGGGGGGSIYISAGGVLSGNGTLSAKGGNGAGSHGGGGGGGGRISVDGFSSSTFTADGGTATVTNGTGSVNGGVGSLCWAGAGGGCIN